MSNTKNGPLKVVQQEKLPTKIDDPEPSTPDQKPDTTSSKQPWRRHYPPGLKWDMPIRPEPLTDWFDQAVEQFSLQNCSDFYGRKMSYVELGRLVDKAACGLQNLGVGKGSKVGLLLPNTPVFIVLYFATLKVGATVVNCNPLYSEDELAFQVNDSGIDIMVTLDLASMYQKTESLLRKGTLKRAIICPFTSQLPPIKAALFALIKPQMIAIPDPVIESGHLIWYADLINNAGEFTPAKIDPEKDIAVLQYTGGTTGTPKGAMLTHANIAANLQQVRAWSAEVAGGRQVIMAILPFFHVFAMTSVMNFGLAAGSKLILMARFEISDALKLIHKHKPTVMPGVPTLFNAILHHPKRAHFDLSSLKFSISGGAALPPDVKKRFEDLTDSQLVEGYGLSETSPVIVCNPVNGVYKPGSIGIPLPQTDISIRSIEDPAEELSLGENGEICVKGPQVMSGYWNKPEENQASFIDGYFRTGDIGHVDEDGYIFIVDRLKDMINASGFKIYPRRVEDAIYAHPAVEEVTVVGILDAYRGEAPKAFIKLRMGHRVSAEEMLDFLKTKISKIELPTEIEFRDELPKTIIGKLSKKELREERQAQEQTEEKTQEQNEAQTEEKN